MAMNWGAALGAALNSGLSTYERLGEEELRDMQRKKMQKEIADEAALDAAWRSTQGRVGQQDEYGQAIQTAGGVGSEQAQMLSSQGALPGNTAEDQAFERASAQSAAGALRENAVRQGAIPEAKSALPEMKPTEYTAKQGIADYLEKSKQVSRKGTLEAIQMKSAIRESDTQDKFDAEMGKLNDTLGRIHGIAETGGLKGLAEAASKEGLKVKFVEGKNGVGSRIQVLGPKGDVIETVSDINTATQKLSDAAMQQFMQKGVSLLGSFDKVAAYMQGEKKIAIQEKEAKDKGNYYNAVANAYNTGTKGGGSGGGVGAALYKKAEELAKDQNGKFFKQPEKAYEFLKRGFNRDAEREEWTKTQRGLIDKGANAKELAEARALWFSPENGYAPEYAIKALKSGINPASKQTFTDKDLEDFNRTFPKTPWQDILGEDNKPKPPPVTQSGGLPVPR